MTFADLFSTGVRGPAPDSRANKEIEVRKTPFAIAAVLAGLSTAALVVASLPPATQSSDAVPEAVAVETGDILVRKVPSNVVRVRAAPFELEIDADLPVALATDFNPGTTPSDFAHLILQCLGGCSVMERSAGSS